MIRKLNNCQVHDPNRGSFFVKLEATKERLQGKPVYVSKTQPEQKFIIVDVDA